MDTPSHDLPESQPIHLIFFRLIQLSVHLFVEEEKEIVWFNTPECSHGVWSWKGWEVLQIEARFPQAILSTNVYKIHSLLFLVNVDEEMVWKSLQVVWRFGVLGTRQQEGCSGTYMAAWCHYANGRICTPTHIHILVHVNPQLCLWSVQMNGAFANYVNRTNCS